MAIAPLASPPKWRHRVNIKGGDLKFISASDQIGYHAYGRGSTIARASIFNAPATGLNGSTDTSTLFDIEDGAAIDAGGAPLVNSGVNSTAIEATVVGTSMNLTGANIIAAGLGAVALKVDSDATGR